MFTLTTGRMGFRLLAGAIAALSLAFAPIAGGGITPAQAQVSISVQFRTALEPYGRWERHPRWGEVWIPANRPRDWRPYTFGHWVYTEDWGWYWIEDEAEAPWGWVAYHYGRWVYDDELHWCWIPGEVWGPAWVQWRRGSDVVGWAALPPDDVIVEYRQRPEVWVFVRAPDFIAPRIAAVVIRQREQALFIRETVVENRTVIIRDRGPRFAVNPGIPAAFIAASLRRPLRAFEVRPRVLAGTAQIRGAVEMRAEDLRRGQGVRGQVSARETQTVIRSTGRVPEPRPLAAGEQGRLGDNPPRAAQREGQRGPQGTEGRGPQPKQIPQTEGKGKQQFGQPEGKSGLPKQPPQPEGKAGLPKQQTEGKGGQPKQLPQTEGKGPQQKRLPQQPEGKGTQPKQPSPTEGRGVQRTQPPQIEERGTQRTQPPQTQGRGREPKQLPGTEGRVRGEPKQLPRTEGRGGGEPKQMPQGRGSQLGGAHGQPQQREQ